jgi:hypothetical protein
MFALFIPADVASSRHMILSAVTLALPDTPPLRRQRAIVDFTRAARVVYVCCYAAMPRYVARHAAAAAPIFSRRDLPAAAISRLRLGAMLPDDAALYSYRRQVATL